MASSLLQGLSEFIHTDLATVEGKTAFRSISKLVRTTPSNVEIATVQQSMQPLLHKLSDMSVQCPAYASQIWCCVESIRKWQLDSDSCVAAQRWQLQNKHLKRLRGRTESPRRLADTEEFEDCHEKDEKPTGDTLADVKNKDEGGLTTGRRFAPPWACRLTIVIVLLSVLVHLGQYNSTSMNAFETWVKISAFMKGVANLTSQKMRTLHSAARRKVSIEVCTESPWKPYGPCLCSGKQEQQREVLSQGAWSRQCSNITRKFVDCSTTMSL